MSFGLRFSFLKLCKARALLLEAIDVVLPAYPIIIIIIIIITLFSLPLRYCAMYNTYLSAFCHGLVFQCAVSIILGGNVLVRFSR